MRPIQKKKGTVRSKKKTKNSFKCHFLFFWLALIVYLFVSAPAPLPDQSQSTKGIQISSYQLFELLQQENDVVRELWTKEIVGQGKIQGFKFSEDWQEEGVEAGPLPALFLRGTALRLEKNPVPLSLFLGSDAPINKANKFDAIQNERFQIIKHDQKPQFFYSEDIERYTGMFPDIASVDPCVDCHNEHDDSQKTDWELLDVMGATTWLYPNEFLSLDEALSILAVLREKFRAVYAAYIVKAQNFSKRPEIANKWPKEGYYLPNTDEFMRVYEEKSSRSSLQLLLKSIKHEQ